MSHDATQHTTHPAKAFLAVLMSGMLMLALLRTGGGGGNPEIARVASGANMAGIFLSAIIAASTTSWRLPIFAKISLFHILGACVLGYLSQGQRGFAYALGTSLPIGLMCAALAWVMLSRDWLVGRIVFWSLVGLIALDLLRIIVR